MLELALAKGLEAFEALQKGLEELAQSKDNATSAAAASKSADLRNSSALEDDQKEVELLRTFFTNTFIVLSNGGQGMTASAASAILESVPFEDLDRSMRHAELIIASKVVFIVIIVFENDGHSLTTLSFCHFICFRILDHCRCCCTSNIAFHRTKGSTAHRRNR